MPGEIAFFQIRGCVHSATPASIPGTLFIRDGVPVLEQDTTSTAVGYRIELRADDARAAYDAIDSIEPAAQYRWEVADGMNILVGRSPRRGSAQLAEDWRSWDDPAFGDALAVVDDALAGEFAWSDFKPFYRLQAAYLLLWSSIERYVSLRYGLGRNEGVSTRIARLAEESAFISASHDIDRSSLQHLRPIIRTDAPAAQYARLDLAGPPEKALDYFYRVRSNVTHRGKEEPLDWHLLHASTTELLRVFRAVLDYAERDSHWYDGVSN